MLSTLSSRVLAAPWIILTALSISLRALLSLFDPPVTLWDSPSQKQSSRDMTFAAFLWIDADCQR
jgi:hypothetical protein